EAGLPGGRGIFEPGGYLSVGGEVRRYAVQCRVALGLDGQVADERVAGLDAVFHEEAVPDGVVGDVVLDQRIVGAVHRHAAAVAVVDRRVPDVLPRRIAGEVPVHRVARQRQVLTHAGQLDARDPHARARHGHDVPAEVGLLGIVRSLNADIAGQQADLAALVDAEG